ncbi:MAG TPA: hypothetical protein PK467_04515 [Candidatus Wallbacteria bacterium]|nr:hypothetical protein [Candidatus Wallbacteria bacterium]
MKYINKNECIGVYNKIKGYVRITCSALLALSAFTAVMAGPAIAAAPASKPLDEKIIEKLDKNERLGFTAFGDIDGDKIDDIILSVDKISSASPQDAPESKLAAFLKDKLTTIDAFSVYIEKLELADIDGCGNKEIIFLRRGGMKSLMEVYALKAEKKDGGEKTFKVLFKSEGVNEGKFDIIKSPEGAVTMVIGGYLAAPGAIAPHLEFSHFYSYDKASSRLKLVKKNYERPKTLSQEYEMAYLSLMENKKDDAVKRLERIIRSAKTAKSEDSADILKECETLLAKIK